MSSPFQLTVTLEQHTPIIHFQHNQEGATLRATEVKPKLDRFLIATVFNDTFDLFKTYLIGYDAQEEAKYVRENKVYRTKWAGKEAFNYKIKILNGTDKTESIPDFINKKKKFETDLYPFVLANMGGQDDKNDLKNLKKFETVDIIFHCLHTSLLKKIYNNIASFFLFHNFGNRQSKGFGSFYPFRKEKNSFIEPLELLQKSNKPIFYFTLPPNDTDKAVFEKADMVYRLLKAGFNFPDYKKDKEGKLDYGAERGEFEIYQKSFIIDYFIKKFKIGSEKRAIKEKLFDPSLRISSDKSLIGGNQYVRAILGSAEFFEYKGKPRNGTVTVKSEEVDRFPSPILFKIIDNSVYLIPGDWSEIKNTSFELNDGRNNPITIKVPNVSLDLKDLLQNFTSHYNSIRIFELNRLFEIRRKGTRDFPFVVKTYMNCLENVELQKLE